MTVWSTRVMSRVNQSGACAVFSESETLIAQKDGHLSR